MIKILILFILGQSLNAGIISYSISKIFKKQPINYGLRGVKHPKTGVKFNRLGYPIFKKIANCTLKPINFQKTREVHFTICNKRIYNQIMKNPRLKNNFSSSDIEKMRNGLSPSDYTWHHHQQKGVLELVNKSIHNKTAHTGGFSQWGDK